MDQSFDCATLGKLSESAVTFCQKPLRHRSVAEVTGLRTTRAARRASEWIPRTITRWRVVLQCLGDRESFSGCVVGLECHGNCPPT